VLEIICDRPQDDGWPRSSKPLPGVREAALFGKGCTSSHERDARTRDPRALEAEGLAVERSSDHAVARGRVRFADRSHDRGKQPHGRCGDERPRVWAVARKEFLHILRDPAQPGHGDRHPDAAAVLFGYALTLDVDNVPLAVWDQSGTPASREFSAGSRLALLLAAAFVATTRDRAPIDTTAALMAAVVDPADFAERLAAGRRPRADDRRRQRLQHGHDRHRLRRGVARIVLQEIALERRCAARRPARTRWIAAPGLVQRRHGIEELHHPRADRGDHDGHRGAADLAHRRARVGARHDGAAHLHAGQGPEADPGQAAALLRHRHARRRAGRADGRVPVRRAPARQRGVALRAWPRSSSPARSRWAC
jgi:hypothetical protein